MYNKNMKISELFKNNKIGAYILGTIFAFKYKIEGDYISLFSSKEQRSTNHLINIDIFDDQITRIESYYNSKIRDNYNVISTNNDVQSILRNQIGLFAIVENDVQENIDFLIFNKLVNNEGESKLFAHNFIRGVVDSRSSADTSTIYIAMDIRKKNSTSFASIMEKSFEILFGDIRKYNVNPRFRQPTKTSRVKNPQFRIPYTVIFGSIGTFRYQFLKKLKNHKNGYYKKFEANTNIPVEFPNLIMWDTSNISYTSRSQSNITVLQGDVEYLNNYDKDIEELLYRKLQEEYSKKISIKKPRISISYANQMLVLKNHHYRDFLEHSKIIEKNKNGDPLLDIHHIIPNRFSYIFNDAITINSLDNLIPLRQDTHYFLHRGLFNEKKIMYLHQLYKHAQKFLIKQNMLKEISFNVFKQMY